MGKGKKGKKVDADKKAALQAKKEGKFRAINTTVEALTGGISFASNAANEAPRRVSIVIPDAATEKPIKGEIIAAGNGKILDNGEVRALDVKVGDRVLFGKYAGTEVKVEGEDLLVMKEDDIMAVIEG